MCNQACIPAPRPIGASGSWGLDCSTGADAGGESIDVGDVIRANLMSLMQQRGLTLASLARRARLDPWALREIIFHDGFPSVGQLWKLARALDVPCTAFVEPVARQMPVAELSSGRSVAGPQRQIS